MGEKIVFLHGWLFENWLYILIKRKIEKTGQTVIMPDLGPCLEDVNEIVVNLERFIEDSLLKDFVLMGHSLGGIIALLYEKRNPGKAKKIIAINSPFGGSPFIFWGSLFSKSAQQIMPGSQFLRRLTEDPSAFKSDVFCFYAEFDELMSKESAQLSFAKNIKINSMGHILSLYSESFIDSLKKIL